MLIYQNININKDLSDYLFSYLSKTEYLKSL